MIFAFAGKVPILGVCMGHECLVEGYRSSLYAYMRKPYSHLPDRYKGKIGHCNEIVHGKTSPIEHDGRGIFAGVPNLTEVTRYHSLGAVKVPEGYKVRIYTDVIILCSSERAGHCQDEERRGNGHAA